EPEPALLGLIDTLGDAGRLGTGTQGSAILACGQIQPQLHDGTAQTAQLPMETGRGTLLGAIESPYGPLRHRAWGFEVDFTHGGGRAFDDAPRLRVGGWPSRVDSCRHEGVSSPSINGNALN